MLCRWVVLRSSNLIFESSQNCRCVLLGGRINTHHLCGRSPYSRVSSWIPAPMLTRELSPSVPASLIASLSPCFSSFLFSSPAGTLGRRTCSLSLYPASLESRVSTVSVVWKSLGVALPCRGWGHISFFFTFPASQLLLVCCVCLVAACCF